MKKSVLLCIALFIILTSCASGPAPEPERCALCDDLARHAPCIINLSTGEKVELDVYEPHPFLVGEIAEEQHGGYFSFVRGAGVEGYKLGAESVTITIPVKSDNMDQRFFCNSCRELLVDCKNQSFVLVDVKDTDNPVVYEICDNTVFTLRCYEVTVKKLEEDKKYEITINGTLENLKQ